MSSSRALHELEFKLDQLLDGLRQQTQDAQRQTMDHLSLYSESLDELQVGLCVEISVLIFFVST